MIQILLEIMARAKLRVSKKQSLHDHFVDDLVLRLKPRYDFISTHVEYNAPRLHKCGEIDILAKFRQYLDLYEVKCNDHYMKAVEQLMRAYDALNQHEYGLEIRLYYYSGNQDLLRRVK